MANMQIVVAINTVEPQYVEMMVPLYSYGCERKVKKTLSHLKGIYSVTVDYRQQKVTVWGICNKYDVLLTMRSKRKEARFWKAEDNIKMEENDQAQPPMPLAPSYAFQQAFFSPNEGSLSELESLEKGLHSIQFILKDK